MANRVIGGRMCTGEAGAALVCTGTGLPIYAVDAAAETDDSYATLITTTRECHNMLAQVETNDAIVSFDGGTTDHLYLTAGTVYHLSGLVIPNGAVIQGKNGVAESDYDNLRIMVW